MGKLAVALIVFSFLLTSCSVGSIIGGGNEVVAKTNANYVDYTSDIIANTSGDKVLFFHATWCGTCKSASKKIAEAETTTGLTVIKVDYDSNTDLRQKYGVTSQHTFVQVDSEGNELAKWSGSKDLSGIRSNLVESDEVMGDEANNISEVTDDAISVEETGEENIMIEENSIEENMETKQEEEITNQEEVSEEVIVKEIESEEELMIKSEGKYVTYSADEVAATSGAKVLFFHATWCPNCKAADTAFNSEETPEDLNIFKVDYDTYTDLKKEYGVTSQTTFVQIDDNGELIKRWFGSRNYSEILAQLQ